MILSENNWHILNQIIYDIYSSDNPHHMRKKFLENIKLLITYDKANFFVTDTLNDDHFITDPVSIGLEESAYDDYYTFFEKFDYNNWMYATAQNEAFILTELLSFLEMKNNLFASKWLVQKGIEHVIILSLSYKGTFVGVASLFRMQGKNNFTFTDKKILNILKNHLSLYLYQNIFPKNTGSALSDTYLINLAKIYHLTPREQEILNLLFTGIKTCDICSSLHISESTMRKHTTNIYKKLGITNRSQLNKIIF